MQCALKWLEKRDLLRDWAEKACVRMRVPGSMPTKKWFPQRYNSLNYCLSVQDQVGWGLMSNLVDEQPTCLMEGVPKHGRGVGTR